MRPNYFLAFELSQPEIHNNLTKLHKDLAAKNPDWKKAFVTVSRSHCSLVAVEIPDGKLEDIKAAFKSEANKMKSELKGLELEVRNLKKANAGGWGHFLLYNEVSISEPHSEKTVTSLILKIREAMKNAGAIPEARNSIWFHMTVLNSKIKSRNVSLTITEDDLTDFRNVYIGKQKVFSVQLLSMREKIDDYYKCEEEVMIN